MSSLVLLACKQKEFLVPKTKEEVVAQHFCLNQLLNVCDKIQGLAKESPVLAVTFSQRIQGLEPLNDAPLLFSAASLLYSQWLA